MVTKRCCATHGNLTCFSCFALLGISLSGWNLNCSLTFSTVLMCFNFLLCYVLSECPNSCVGVCVCSGDGGLWPGRAWYGHGVGVPLQPRADGDDGARHLQHMEGVQVSCCSPSDQYDLQLMGCPIACRPRPMETPFGRSPKPLWSPFVIYLSRSVEGRVTPVTWDIVTLWTLCYVAGDQNVFIQSHCLSDRQ